MRENEKNKLDNKLIKENSYNRNIDTINLIEQFDISLKRVQDLTEEDIRQLFVLLINLNKSQSNLDKVYDEIHQVAVMSRRYDLFEDIKRGSYISNISIAEVLAFSLEEERQLLDYINDHEDSLVDENRSNIDNVTIKNLLKLDFATGMRIGELCSLYKDSNIDKIRKSIIVEKTVTKDIYRKSVIGSTTKTGRKKQAQGLKDERIVPFRSFV